MRENFVIKWRVSVLLRALFHVGPWTRLLLQRSLERLGFFSTALASPGTLYLPSLISFLPQWPGNLGWVVSKTAPGRFPTRSAGEQQNKPRCCSLSQLCRSGSNFVYKHDSVRYERRKFANIIKFNFLFNFFYSFKFGMSC